MDIVGRIAVVTGGAAGIGLGLARAFAGAGARVVLADIEQGALDEAVALLRSDGHAVLGIRTDVSDHGSVDALAQRVIAECGGVDILCNNAGVAPDRRPGAVWEIPLEDWKWGLDVNLMGIVHGIRSFVPILLKQDRPAHVVNTVSIMGLISGSVSPVYCTTKFAALRVTESLYASLGERGSKIGVSVLCPGIVQTQLHRTERNRPEALRHGGITPVGALNMPADVLRSQAMTPDEVGQITVDAVRENRFYVLTSDFFDAAIRARTQDILARRNPVFPDASELLRQDIAQMLVHRQAAGKSA